MHSTGTYSKEYTLALKRGVTATTGSDVTTDASFQREIGMTTTVNQGGNSSSNKNPVVKFSNTFQKLAFATRCHS